MSRNAHSPDTIAVYNIKQQIPLVTGISFKKEIPRGADTYLQLPPTFTHFYRPINIMGYFTIQKKFVEDGQVSVTQSRWSSMKNRKS